MSLFTEWSSLNASMSTALKTMNSELLGKYTKDDLDNWRLRKEAIPEQVKKYMRKQAIPVVALEHKISVDTVKKIIESLL